MVARVKHGLRPLRHAPERRAEVDLLERTRSEHLGVDLTGQRQDRRAVDVGVPQAGEQLVAPGPAIEKQAAGRPVNFP